MIVTRSRLQDENDQLTERGADLDRRDHAQFDGAALQADDEPPHHDALAFKSA